MLKLGNSGMFFFRVENFFVESTNNKSTRETPSKILKKTNEILFFAQETPKAKSAESHEIPRNPWKSRPGIQVVI